jgi:hypothetical protein
MDARKLLPWGSMRSFAPVLAKRLEEHYGPPLIVIGMHRSGTTLVARLLRACGGHFGTELDGNSEPIQIIRVNNALLRCFGANWRRLPADLPERRRVRQRRAVRMLLRRHHWVWHALFDSFAEKAREGAPRPPRLPVLWSPREVEWPIPSGAPALWGWKDPRTTLTLAVWLELFPHARIVHVIRSGVDVAHSLQQRSLRHGVGAPECDDLRRCFELWERYVEEGLGWRHLPASRYLELRYEALLEDPRRQLARVLEFAGADPAHAEREEVLRLCQRQSRSALGAHRPSAQAEAELLEKASRSRCFEELGYAARQLAAAREARRRFALDDAAACE